MSSRVDTDPISSGSEASEVAVSVAIGEEDLARLQELASAAGVGEPGARTFADLLSSTLHRGIIESHSSAAAGAPGNPARADLGSATRGESAAEIDSPTRVRMLLLRRFALAAAAGVIGVMLVGSYVDDWTWTGFRVNGQLWDWMQLLLLPVAIGTFPLWLRFSGEMSPMRRKALGAAVLAFAAFALVGYLVPLKWTGFRGHTLWNWLTLIVLPITVTAVAVWPKTGRRFRPVYGLAAGVLGLLWIVTVIGGYAGHWAWTGYSGNTFWDWMKLFLAPIAITTFVVPQLSNLLAGEVADGQG